MTNRTRHVKHTDEDVGVTHKDKKPVMGPGLLRSLVPSLKIIE